MKVIIVSSATFRKENAIANLGFRCCQFSLQSVSLLRYLSRFVLNDPLSFQVTFISYQHDTGFWRRISFYLLQPFVYVTKGLLKWTKPVEIIDLISSVVYSGADPGFPVGGGAKPHWGANIQICQIFPKTA